MKKWLLVSIIFISLKPFAQNVGIGTVSPTKAGLVVNSKVSNTHAIFGDNTSGVSLESNFPGVYFNSYYNFGRRTLVTGYTSGAEMDPATGNFNIYTSPASTTAGNIASVFLRVNVEAGGNVGIGVADPTALLHVNGGVKINGVNSLEFGANLVSKEINAGKIGYALFTSDALDITGAGTNANPRKIRLWAEGGTRLEGPLNTSRIYSYTGLTSDAVTIDAKVSRTAQGTADLLPIAMGYNSYYNNFSSTPNVTIVSSASDGRIKKLTIAGHSLTPGNYVVIANPVFDGTNANDGHTASVSFIGGAAYINVLDGNTNLTRWPFQFIVYKMN